MEEINVVCAIIKEDNKVLIAQRSSKVGTGVWEFPGGKVERGESKEAACIREIKEELQLDIVIDRFVCDIVDTAFTPHVHVFAYEAHRVDGEVLLSVHSNYLWIDPKDVFLYPFQTADEPIKRAIQKGR